MLIIYRKRRGGTEIDYLAFSFFRFRIWVTRSVCFSKYPRLVIWKMAKGQNTHVEKGWNIKFD
jgi:hypothetical protein